MTSIFAATPLSTPSKPCVAAKTYTVLPPNWWKPTGKTKVDANVGYIMINDHADASDLDDVYDLLVSGADNDEIVIFDQPIKTETVVRRACIDHEDKGPAGLVDQGIQVLPFDFDKLSHSLGLSAYMDDLTRIGQHMTQLMATIVPEFKDAAMVWQATSSHGMEDEAGLREVRVRAFVPLQAPIPHEKAKALAKYLNARSAQMTGDPDGFGLDESVMDRARFCFLSDPVFRDEMGEVLDDPYPGKRWIKQQGTVIDLTDCELADYQMSKGNGKTSDPATDPILARLRELDMLKKDLGGGRYSIVCPWHEEHASGPDKGVGDTSTVFMLAHHSGYSRASFKCLHETCAKAFRATDVSKMCEAIGIEEPVENIAATLKDEWVMVTNDGSNPKFLKRSEPSMRPIGIANARAAHPRMVPTEVHKADGSTKIEWVNVFETVRFDLPRVMKLTTDPFLPTGVVRLNNINILNTFEAPPIFDEEPECKQAYKRAWVQLVDHLFPKSDDRAFADSFTGHMIQKPAIRPHRHLLHISTGFGTGRSTYFTLLMNAVNYGRSRENLLAVTPETKVLTGSDYLGNDVGKLMVAFEEIPYDLMFNRAEANLRDFFTRTQQSGSFKYMPNMTVPCINRAFLATNHRVAINLEGFQRRLYVVETNKSLDPDLAKLCNQEMARSIDFQRWLLWWLAQIEVDESLLFGNPAPSETMLEIAEAAKNPLDEMLETLADAMRAAKVPYLSHPEVMGLLMELDGSNQLKSHIVARAISDKEPERGLTKVVLRKKDDRNAKARVIVRVDWRRDQNVKRPFVDKEFPVTAADMKKAAALVRKHL